MLFLTYSNETMIRLWNFEVQNAQMNWYILQTDTHLKTEKVASFICLRRKNILVFGAFLASFRNLAVTFMVLRARTGLIIVVLPYQKYVLYVLFKEESISCLILGLFCHITPNNFGATVGLKTLLDEVHNCHNFCLAIFTRFFNFAHWKSPIPLCSAWFVGNHFQTRLGHFSVPISRASFIVQILSHQMSVQRAIHWAEKNGHSWAHL